MNDIDNLIDPYRGLPFFAPTPEGMGFSCPSATAFSSWESKPLPLSARFSEDKRNDMKFLTLEKIKAQCRIEQDFTDEDELLEMYGESAEEVLLNHLNRSFEDIMEVYGRIPAPLTHAALMLVDVSYTRRSPVSPQNMSIVPYTFDILVKPYMRLADYNDSENNNNRYGCKNL